MIAAAIPTTASELQSTITFTEPSVMMLSSTPRSYHRFSLGSPSDDWYYWAGNRLDALNGAIGGLLLYDKLRIPSSHPYFLKSGWFCDTRIDDAIDYVRPESGALESHLWGPKQSSFYKSVVGILERDYQHRLRPQIISAHNGHKEILQCCVDEHCQRVLLNIERAANGGAPILHTQLETPFITAYRLVNAGDSPALLQPIEIFAEEWEEDSAGRDIGVQIKARYIFLVLALLGVDRFEDLLDYVIELRASDDARYYRESGLIEADGPSKSQSGNKESIVSALTEGLKSGTISAMEMGASLDLDGPELDIGFSARFLGRLLTTTGSLFRRRVEEPDPQRHIRFLGTLRGAVVNSDPMQNLFQTHMNMEPQIAGRLVGVLHEISMIGKRSKQAAYEMAIASN